MPVAAMSGRRIPLADLGGAELDRWRRLAAAAIEPNPFFEPEYVLAQARALDAVGDVALAVVAATCAGRPAVSIPRELNMSWGYHGWSLMNREKPVPQGGSYPA